MANSKKVRHLCGISGGKDSAALAIYLKEQGRIPDMEYFFADTGCELPETYDFIDRLEAYLGKEIKHIGDEAPFDHHLFMHGNMLPSPQQRWCTVKMKLQPFEKLVGNDKAKSYIAIRIDELRDGYISNKPNITPVFPFIKDEIARKDVFNILERTVGIPEYYKWRSRSGCYFCFFQRREAWIGLKDNHPELFKKAMEMEKKNSELKKGYTWIEGMSLKELLEKRDNVVDFAQKRRDAQDKRTWQEKLIDEGDPEDQGCLICSL